MGAIFKSVVFIREVYASLSLCIAHGFALSVSCSVSLLSFSRFISGLASLLTFSFALEQHIVFPCASHCL